MATVRNYQFSSKDSQFQLIITSKLMDEMLSFCKEIENLETGRILIGHYSDSLDRAIVTRISEAPSDSIKRKSSFFRGSKGLLKLLNKIWPKKEYYLGEWHYHPYSSPRPSRADQKQMRCLSSNTKLNCPEPILLIVGGNPIGNWTITVHVFESNLGMIHLLEIY